MEHEKYFQYFDRAVLSFYRTNSHAYQLSEDDMGGEITISSEWNESMENEFPHIELKFAFKKLVNETVCLGVFMPSFKDKVSEKDYSKWIGFHIKDPKFHKNNQDFERWINNSEDGVGLRAPVGSKLIINGGWLDEHGGERVDPYKAGRNQEIYNVGFT